MGTRFEHNPRGVEKYRGPGAFRPVAPVRHRPGATDPVSVRSSDRFLATRGRGLARGRGVLAIRRRFANVRGAADPSALIEIDAPHADVALHDARRLGLESAFCDDLADDASYD